MKKLTSSEVDLIARKIARDINKVVSDKNIDIMKRNEIAKNKALSNFYKSKLGKAIKVIQNEIPATLKDVYLNKIINDQLALTGFEKEPLNNMVSPCRLSEELTHGLLLDNDLKNIIEQIKEEYLNKLT